jgi:hypothetical protein
MIAKLSDHQLLEKLEHLTLSIVFFRAESSIEHALVTVGTGLGNFDY